MPALDSKIAIITGAASGIGAATARLFIAEGASVVGIDRDAAGLEAVASDLGASFAFVAGDITRRATLDDAVAKAVDQFGNPNIAILNAGMDGPMAPLLDIDTADFDPEIPPASCL